MTMIASLEPVEQTPSHETRKRGFTLTEIAIVLGIIGLILGAIWVAAAAVYNNLRVSHANTAILQTAQAIRSLYSTSSTMGAAGDITGTIIAANGIPSDLVTSTTTAVSVWAGGTYKVLTVAATDTAFTIEMTKVPTAACASLISTVAGNTRDPGLTAVGATVATAPIQAATAGTALALSTTPVAAITPATAATACVNASGGPVQFEFTIK